MKRRIFSLFLLMMMVASLAVPANAAGGSVDHGDVIEVMDASSLVSGHLVFYPKALETSSKTYPVVVWANGTMCAPVLYENLLISIARQGYVVVASSKVMSADGKDQCKSVDYILGKNKDAKSVFYGKIDETKIAAAGHSQGGRSAVNAANQDSRIKCIVSIAGSSLADEAKKLKTPALFLFGGADLVVPAAIWGKPAYNKAQGPAAYAVLKGAIHTTCCIAPAKISDYTVRWLNAWLLDSNGPSDFAPKGALSKDTAWKDFASKGIK